MKSAASSAPAGLYVHIPFCQMKCRFCDFAAYPGLMKEVPRYLAALAKEAQSFQGRKVDTVFLGGGTPTVLDPPQLKRLLDDLRAAFRWAPKTEATVECNPETSDRARLEILRTCGVNRLSFGLQASQDRLLKALGRLHDFSTFEAAFAEARALGFNNLSADLMFGLPDQSMQDWRETLDRVLELEPEHLSCYALTVEARTAFKCSGVDTDADLQAEMYEEAAERLERAGFIHYEISNFALPGRECGHNLKYWKNQPCLALGVSAAGYDGGARWKNAERVGDYLAAVEAGKSPRVESTVLSEPEKVGEDLMLALRLKEGAALTPRMRELYGAVLEKYRALGFLEIHAGRVRPTRRGWLLSNQLFQELLEPA